MEKTIIQSIDLLIMSITTYTKLLNAKCKFKIKYIHKTKIMKDLKKFSKKPNDFSKIEKNIYRT